MKAIILAAGHGKRMQPLTLTQSKCMIPVANKPIIGWTMDFLEKADEVLVVARRDQKDLLDYLSGRKKTKIVFQDELLGTGHALLQCKNHVQGTFMVMNGDDFYGREDIEKALSQAAPLMAVHESNQPEKYGVVETNNGVVKSLEEKPAQPKANTVNCALYVLNDSVFGILENLKKSPRGEYELTDVIKHFIENAEQGADVKAHLFDVWIPMSYPWSILDVNEYILKEKGSMIADDVEIRKGVVLEEPVCIGSGSVIGPNCFIRRYSSIGSNCKIDQGIEIKNSIIMDNCFISHNSYVGDSVIGRNCNIAAGSIFANLRLDEKNVKVVINGERMDSGTKKLGAIIGDNVKFGVRVTVMPGKRIWPNLLIPPCMTVDEDIKKDLPLSRWQEKREE